MYCTSTALILSVYICVLEFVCIALMHYSPDRGLWKSVQLFSGVSWYKLISRLDQLTSSQTFSKTCRSTDQVGRPAKTNKSAGLRDAEKLSIQCNTQIQLDRLWKNSEPPCINPQTSASLHKVSLYIQGKPNQTHTIHIPIHILPPWG